MRINWLQKMEEREEIAVWNADIKEDMTFDESTFGTFGSHPQKAYCMIKSCNQATDCIHCKLFKTITDKHKQDSTILGLVEFPTSSISEDSPIKEISNFDDLFDCEQEAYWIKAPETFQQELTIHIVQNIKESIDHEYPKQTALKKKATLVKFKWDSIPIPDEYKIAPEIWYSMIAAAKAAKNVIIVGPTGCGKTEIIKAMANAISSNYEGFNLGAMSDPRGSLLGNQHFSKEIGTHFAEARFVKAFQSPNMIINLDEISRAGPPAFNILLPALDRQGYLALDETVDARIVNRHPELSFFATANVGMEYTGTMQLDAALLNRFAMYFEFDFPPEDDEVDIIIRRNPGVDKAIVKQLVKFANRQREETNKGNYPIAISTRMLIETGWALNQGLDKTRVFLDTIGNHFSKVGGTSSDRAKLLQLLQGSGY